MKESQQPNLQTLSRKKFLRLIALLGASNLACKLPQFFAGDQERAPDKETESGSDQFGWNTHLNPNAKGEGSNLTLEVFKEDIDKMAEWGHKALRFNIAEWDAVSGLQKGQHFEWNWKEAELAVYREALEYAKEKGMTITLVANTPGSARILDFPQYARATELFFGQLAKRFKGLVDIWQIFNEPDDHHYKTYSKVNEYPDNYLEEFGILVATANMAIKLNDANAKTTVNVSKWVGADPGIQLEELLLFDKACGFDSTKPVDSACKHLDYITLDLYPDDNQEEIAALPTIVDFFHQRYSKPIIIGELGLPTTAFSEADQGKFVTQAISSLMSGKTKPEQIILYEMRDEIGKGGNEAAFGFHTIDGQPKASLEAVVEAMVYEEEK